MSADEITQRAEAFRNSIAAGRVTLADVTRTVNGWQMAGLITPSQRHNLLALVSGS
jgi:hypothetical protein